MPLQRRRGRPDPVKEAQQKAIPILLKQSEDVVALAKTGTGKTAAFEENVKGTLAPGKLADFVIISDDITKVEPQKIKDLKILKTFVGGEKVFDANMMPKKDN